MRLGERRAAKRQVAIDAKAEAQETRRMPKQDSKPTGGSLFAIDMVDLTTGRPIEVTVRASSQTDLDNMVAKRLATKKWKLKE